MDEDRDDPAFLQALAESRSMALDFLEGQPSGACVFDVRLMYLHWLSASGKICEQNYARFVQYEKFMCAYPTMFFVGVN